MIGSETQMQDEGIAGFGASGGVFGRAGETDGEKTGFARSAQESDFRSHPQSGRLQFGAEESVHQSQGREIGDALQARRLPSREGGPTQQEGIGSAGAHGHRAGGAKRRQTGQMGGGVLIGVSQGGE